jgi:hypothetical protein
MGKYDAKTLVEDCRNLDISRLVRQGVVSPEVRKSGRWVWSRNGAEVASIGYESHTESDSGMLRLYYTVNRGEKQESLDYEVPLVTTVLPSRGRRWWFRCAASRGGGPPCGRRAGKLYRPRGCDIFACRKCHDLAYKSSRESRRFDRLYRRLAAETGFSFGMVKLAMRRVRR